MEQFSSPSPLSPAMKTAYQRLWRQLEATHGHVFTMAFLTDYAPEILSALGQLQCSSQRRRYDSRRTRHIRRHPC